MSTRRTFSFGIRIVSTMTLLVTIASAQTIKADHTTVDVTVLSTESVSDAQALTMSFSHASVGGNLWSGLDALANENSDFSHPNWTDNNRGNPGWAAKVTEFEGWVVAHANEYDVFQNKFCFIDQDADFATYRDSMDGLVADYPEKTFVYWTIPLQTTGADNALRDVFNEQVRKHCADNDLPLFDLADIESHKTDGTAVTESGNVALDPDQSSDGGHLNDLGSARAAAAQWALMAQIAGHTVTGSTGGPNGGSTTTSGATDTSNNDSSGCNVARKTESHPLLAVLGFAALSLLLRRKR